MTTFFWNLLSTEDQNDYYSIKNRFLERYEKITIIDLLNEAWKFVFKSPEFIEERSIVVGIAFYGPYLVFNSEQLKITFFYPKSQFLTGIHTIGYGKLENEAQSRSIISNCLPQISNDTPSISRWSLRSATDSSIFCFLNPFMKVNTLITHTLPSIPKSQLETPEYPHISGNDYLRKKVSIPPHPVFPQRNENVTFEPYTLRFTDDEPEFSDNFFNSFSDE